MAQASSGDSPPTFVAQFARKTSAIAQIREGLGDNTPAQSRAGTRGMPTATAIDENTLQPFFFL